MTNKSLPSAPSLVPAITRCGVFAFMFETPGGKLALCREWIAGRIAQLMGLPIPPFAQANVPQDLIGYSAIEGCEELGAGIAFGSEHVDDACDLPFSQIESVPKEVRFRTLLFDWLVQNGDRTLGETGGNVNLLWVEREDKAYIIDHNLAFDEGTC